MVFYVIALLRQCYIMRESSWYRNRHKFSAGEKGGVQQLLTEKNIDTSGY